MVVDARAVYDNHDEWPSPIGVTDDPNWATTYGTDLPATLIDTADGKMSASVSIHRAGAYELSITVDGTNVINSPHQYLNVQPAALDATNCVGKDIPEVMYAGIDYSFQIQGRD